MEVKIRSITLGGKLGDAGFEQCRLALESISKTHPEISITINSFFETQWEEYLTYTKSIKGGDFYFHKGSPLTFYNENIYIGDLQPFLKWAQLKLRYFDHRSDYKKQSERNVMKVMKAGVISGNRGYVYMKIKLQGKTHQVVFELFQDLAPKSSLNFATLCEGKFKNEDNEIIGYKGSNVHRIVKGAYVQAGKMNIKGSKTIFGKEFEDESFATIHDHIGILGMAKKNGVAHTNECEFYVTTAAPLTFLDKKYVAFGRVIEGFEAFRAMQDLEIKNQRPETPVEIVKAGWLIEPLKPKVELEVKNADVKVPEYEEKLRTNEKDTDKTASVEPLQSKIAANDMLRINFVQAENLWTADDIKGSEINAVLKLDNAKVFETHDIKNSLSPVWNYSRDIEIVIKGPTPKLTVECLNCDTFLGEVEVDLSKILEKPRTWVVDGAIKLEDPNKIISLTHKDKLSGTIYLQICYIPKGSDIPTLPKPTQAKDPPTLTQVDMLSINFVHGKDLMTGDATSSDPFATLQLGKKDLAATPAIKGTLNPVWDFSKVAKIAKDWENPPSLTLTCWDHDIMGDDFLGEASIDLDSILKQPNKWGLNEEIKLGDPNNRLKAKIDANKLGRILVQICYLPKGTDRKHFPSHPEVKEN